MNRLKKYGVVYTPSHLAKLMTRLLRLEAMDTVLDPCAGSGHLLRECRSVTSHVTGYEILPELCTDPDITNANFLEIGNETYDKIIMNPPYKKDTELKFILKALDKHLKSGGVLVCIIPPAKFRNENLKRQIMAIASIEHIIFCNPYAFNDAGIKTWIISFRKGGTQGPVRFTNYTVDYTVQRNPEKFTDPDMASKAFKHVFDTCLEGEYTAPLAGNWWNRVFEERNLAHVESVATEAIIGLSNRAQVPMPDIPEADSRIRSYTVSQLFDLPRVLRLANLFDLEKLESGDIPVVSAKIFNSQSRLNIPNEYIVHASSDRPWLSVGHTEGPYPVHIHTEPFAATSHVFLLCPKFRNMDQLKRISAQISFYGLWYGFSMRPDINTVRQWKVAFDGDLGLLPLDHVPIKNISRPREIVTDWQSFCFRKLRALDIEKESRALANGSFSDPGLQRLHDSRGAHIVKYLFDTNHNVPRKYARDSRVTPDHLCHLMTSLLDIQDNVSILDPCAGTGALLYYVINECRDRVTVCETRFKELCRISLGLEPMDHVPDTCFDRIIMHAPLIDPVRMSKRLNVNGILVFLTHSNYSIPGTDLIIECNRKIYNRKTFIYRVRDGFSGKPLLYNFTKDGYALKRFHGISKQKDANVLLEMAKNLEPIPCDEVQPKGGDIVRAHAMLNKYLFAMSGRPTSLDIL